MNNEREEFLLDWMESQQVDGFFIGGKENVRYISGYTSADAYLLVTKEKRYIITDPRYTEQAGAECPEYEVIVWRKPGKTVGDAVGALAERHALRTIAFEPERMNYTWHQDFLRAVKAELVPAPGVIEGRRAVKNAREIACLRAACDISCRAFERLLSDIRVGVTEKELAARLSLYMVLEGADTQPYGNILISGPRTSLLHGIPSDRALRYGDPVLMDFGCQYDGYLSDMTRTVFVGRADERQREVYALEQRMVEESSALMKAGASSKKIYEASTAAIRGTEYFDYHYSGIGHGIGMFVHEVPFLGPNSDAVLEAGNVVTIEPGIYIPGWGGVRIEDQLLITPDGNENLIHTTHDLIEI